MMTRWCFSYSDLTPLRMSCVSMRDGWSTNTGWKRRSRAASCSMYLRYSLSVVAPMHWISPRASAGLRMLAASIAPSAAPAPTRVCSSSMNSTTSRLERISSRIFLSLSSNSPRYFVPATSAPISSVSTRLCCSDSGTLPRLIDCARPSAIAVLPTPGSPMSAGLFLGRRLGFGLRARVVKQALDLGAHLLEVRAKVFEDVRSDALALDEQAEEQVLCADVVVAHPPRFLERDLDDLLDTRRRNDLLDDDPLVPAEDRFDGLPDFADLYPKVVENLGGQAFTFTEQPQEEMLGADIAVVRSFCFFLSKRQNLLGPLSKSLKRIQDPYPPGLLLRLLGGASTSSTLHWYRVVPLHLI